jgi:hypothetical protein
VSAASLAAVGLHLRACSKLLILVTFCGKVTKLADDTTSINGAEALIH